MHTRSQILPAIITAAIIGTAGIADAGILSYTPLTGDLDSGIDSDLVYTALADFHGTGSRAVNGVLFADTGLTGTGYSLSGPTNPFPNSANSVTGEVGGMLTDFLYGPAAGVDATLTLTGLTIGTEYVTTWYNRGFGDAGRRFVFITASDTPDGNFRIDQNFTGNGNGNVFRYTFTATAETQTYAIDGVTGDSFHHYAFSNAVRNDAILPFTGAPVAPRISTLKGAGPQTPAGVSGTDLLQTHLGGVTVSGAVNTSEGTGGVEVLTDGSFTAGEGKAVYFAAEAGASVTFDLDVTINALGYDVSSVRGYGGWHDNGRDQQNYSLFYSLVGDSAFQFLGTVNFNGGSEAGIVSTITSAFDTDLSGVDAIRVDFLSPQEAGYAGYGEFDVIGIASVPEPSSFLLLLGAIPLLQRRRRA